MPGVRQGLPYAIFTITLFYEGHYHPTSRMRKLRLTEVIWPAHDRTGPSPSGPELDFSKAALGQQRWGPARTDGNPRPRGYPVRGRAQEGVGRGDSSP